MGAEINDFISIMAVGVALSLVIQIIKKYFGTTSAMTSGLTLVLAIIVGAAYVWLRSTPYFETVVLVLTTASTVYAFIVRPAEKVLQPPY